MSRQLFLSWSGEKGRKIATALREWLPLIVPNLQPYMSEHDIHVGTSWARELADSLESSYAGLLCMTSDSIEAPWVLFEAGAIAKAVQDSRVCPLLLGVQLDQLPGPLGQFQATHFGESGVRKLVLGLNEWLPEDFRLDPQLVECQFRQWWPRLYREVILVEPNLKGAARVSLALEASEIMPLAQEVTHEHCRMLGERILRRVKVALTELASGGLATFPDEKEYFRMLNSSVEHLKPGETLHGICGNKNWDRDFVGTYLNKNVDAARRGVQVHRIYVEPSGGFPTGEREALVEHENISREAQQFDVTVVDAGAAEVSRETLGLPNGFGLAILDGKRALMHHGAVEDGDLRREFSAEYIVAEYEKIFEELCSSESTKLRQGIDQENEIERNRTDTTTERKAREDCQ